ncbi:MAG: arsenate reductase ArsC [Pseudomonadota bacterium]
MPRRPDLPGAVLFACGRNAIRSPMAEALAQRLFPGQIYVESAGVLKGDPDPFVASVMEEIGVDMSRHTPKTIDELADSNFDLVISLAPEAHHKALEMTRTEYIDVEYWPTMDPSVVHGSRAQILDAYRSVRDRLKKQIEDRFGWKPAAPD